MTQFAPSHLLENRELIEAGRHGGWLAEFGQNYLFEPEKLTKNPDYGETPIRALRNSLTELKDKVPALEALGRRQGVVVADILLAACLARFRDGESLDTIDSSILAAVKAEMSSYPTLEEGEERAFEDELDHILFAESGAAEDFARRFLEVQLASSEETPTRVDWLERKTAFQHLRATLPLEWLGRFPFMPLEAVRQLFELAAVHADRTQLAQLIDARLADPVADSGTDADKRGRARRKFWLLNSFFFSTGKANESWAELRADSDTIFAIEDRTGRFGRSEGAFWPPLTAEAIYKIFDAFVTVWPKVHLPSSFGSGDPPNEKAYRFLHDCGWRIANDLPDRRLPVLERMLADPRFETFRDILLTVRAEAKRQLALQDFRAPAPSDISALLEKNDIATVEDLRALLVEELVEVQKWLKGSETDPLDTFYESGKHVDENTARNRIVDRLNGRMTALGLSMVIEHHMAAGNRCDFTAAATVSGARFLLVVEVKGQWNTHLFTAAAAQLDERYAIHPDAARQGVYLVLWFGNGETVAGKWEPSITSPEQLRNQIVGKMAKELDGLIDVVVLDLSRPAAVAKKADVAKKKVRSRRSASKKPAKAPATKVKSRRRKAGLL